MQGLFYNAGTRDARRHFFRATQTGSSLSEVLKTKTGKMTRARKEKGPCSGPWRVPLPSPILGPSADWPHITSVPAPTLVLEEEEDLEVEDVETVLSSEDN